jgi:peptidoglycan/xylan/chitin deacetylase (PgdA/CDA1 family)
MALTTMLRRGMKAAAWTADRVRRPAAGLVVLIYHRVGTGAVSEIDLPVGSFDDQMAHLAASRTLLTLDEGVAWISGRATAAATEPVAVTFDDGTADFVDHALAVIVRHRVPVLLYVATDFVETGRPFPWGSPPASWAGLADALSTGLVSIGSHTHTHALLDRLAPDAVEDELDRSIGLIRDRLGVDPVHFAYPKAVLGSPAAQAAVRARFGSAAVSGLKANRQGHADPWRLARSPIQTSDTPRYFRQKAAGGMALEDTLRARLNRRRYADATT